MKANRVIQQVNSEATRTADFVKAAKKERNGVNPKTGETLVILAKPATPIITINEKNQISFNKEVIEQYGLNGKKLTIVNVEGVHYLALTSNTDVSGLEFKAEAKTQKFTASYFVETLRNVTNCWSNNFVLEEVQQEVPFVQGVEKVFVGKLNIKPSTRSKKA